MCGLDIENFKTSLDDSEAQLGLRSVRMMLENGVFVISAQCCVTEVERARESQCHDDR